VLVGASCGCRRNQKRGHPHESRRRSRAGGSRGVALGCGWTPRRFAHSPRRRQVAAAPLRCVGAGRRLLPGPVNRAPQPQTPSAPACSRLRLPCPCLPGRPTVASGEVGRGAPRVRLRRIVFQGCPPSPPLISIFWVVGRGNVTQAIDAPTEKLAAVGRWLNAPASSLPACAGECLPPGISLRSTRRTLTVFRPPTPMLRAPAPGRVSLRSLGLPGTHCLPPRHRQRRERSALREPVFCNRRHRLALPPPGPPRQAEPLRRPTATPLDPASPPAAGAAMVLGKAKTSLETC